MPAGELGGDVLRAGGADGLACGHGFFDLEQVENVGGEGGGEGLIIGEGELRDRDCCSGVRPQLQAREPDAGLAGARGFLAGTERGGDRGGLRLARRDPSQAERLARIEVPISRVGRRPHALRARTGLVRAGGRIRSAAGTSSSGQTPRSTSSSPAPKRSTLARPMCRARPRTQHERARSPRAQRSEAELRGRAETGTLHTLP